MITISANYLWTEISPNLDIAERDVATDAQRKRFAELVDQWRAATEHLSSVTERSSHPAYREVVAMGAPAIALILKELLDRPDGWFDALYEITRIDPVTDDQRGKMNEMVAAWVQWGRNERYLRSA